MTYIDIINKVLRRLREDAVTSVDESSYSSMIADMVQEALSEVEDAWDWNALRTTIQVTTTDGDFSYSLGGAGTSFRVFDVHEDSQDYDLVKAGYEYMNHALLSDPPSDKPVHWDINGVDGNGDPVVNFYPIPDGVYYVNFNMKIKSDWSSDDGTAVCVIPWLPVYRRALMLAVEERGDDQGLSLSFLQDVYTKSLGDAIAYDVNLNADETIWYEV